MQNRNKTLTTALWLLLWAQLHVLPAHADTVGRIVSTNAGATEILLALGVGDALVGIDDSSEPLLDRELPTLGYSRALPAEGLIALGPELVVGSEEMGPAHVLEALSRSNIPVLQLPSPRSVADLRANITEVAQAVGSDGDALQAALQQKTSALQAQAADQPLRAAFLLLAAGNSVRMAGRDTAGAAFIDLLAADNAADHDGYRTLSPEALLELQPDVLLFADTGDRDADQVLESMPVLRFSQAQQNGRLVMVDANSLVVGLSMGALDEALRVLRVIAR